MRHAFKSASFCLAFGAIVLALSGLYGVLPIGRIHSLGISYIHLGFIECISRADSWLACPDASLPTDFRLPFGLPMAMLASAFQRVANISAIEAYDIAGLLILLIGVVSCYILLRFLGAATFWAIAGSLLFYSLPIVHDKAGYGFLMWGFVLFPLAILSVVALWRLHSIVLASLILFSVMTLSLFQEPYSFVMAFVFGTIWSAFHLVFQIKHHRAVALARTAVWIAAIAAAVLLYKLYIPESETYAKMPEDFFRGQGIDLVAFFSRSPDLFLVPSFWGLDDLNPLRFYTDGESTRDSYFGFALSAGIIIFLAVTKFWRTPHGLSVFTVAMAAFILSLGPSLKINDQREVISATSQISFSDYLMPETAATADLPHSFIYSIPPISVMRSVSRWHLLSALMAVAMLTLALSALHNKTSRVTSIVALVLAGIAAAEYLPNLDAKEQAARRMEEAFVSFNEEAPRELERFLKQGDRVLFLQDSPYTNEYLSLYLCAMARCQTFNAPSDKAASRAAGHWPSALNEALALYKTPELQAKALAKLVDDQMIDAIVIPHFDMRWDSYTWPPDLSAATARAKNLTSPFAHLQNVRIMDGSLFSVVRAVN